MPGETRVEKEAQVLGGGDKRDVDTGHAEGWEGRPFCLPSEHHGRGFGRAEGQAGALAPVKGQVDGVLHVGDELLRIRPPGHQGPVISKTNASDRTLIEQPEEGVEADVPHDGREDSTLGSTEGEIPLELDSFVRDGNGAVQEVVAVPLEEEGGRPPGVEMVKDALRLNIIEGSLDVEEDAEGVFPTGESCLDFPHHGGESWCRSRGQCGKHAGDRGEGSPERGSPEDARG